MPYTKLNFGKYRGHTLPWVAFHDPDWFFWANSQRILAKRGYDAEATKICRDARAILPPERYGKVATVEYLTHEGKCFGFHLNGPTVRPKGMSSSLIDLSYPFQFSRYNKGGYKNFLRHVKECLFGDADCRMTERRCQQFFADESNFDPDDRKILFG